jgi:hypothetical protein
MFSMRSVQKLYREASVRKEATQASCLFRRLKVPEDVLQLNGRDIPFVNKATYLGVTLDRRMTWRHHIERTVAKALRTYLRTYSLFRSERLSTNIKLTLYKALMKSIIRLSHLGVRGGLWPLETAAPAGQSSPRYWKPWQGRTGPRIARGFQNSLVYDQMTKLCRIKGISNPKLCKSKYTWYWTRSHAYEV